ISDPAVGLTPASLVEDEPIAPEDALGGWSPRNYDRRYRGDVTLREALEESLNPPVVRVAEQIGFERVARFGESLALGRDGLPRVPAIALGAFEASLLDVAASYSVFPGGGEQVAPRFIEAVDAASGATLLHTEPEGTQLVDPAAAYVVHTMLEGVFERGTA